MSFNSSSSSNASLPPPHLSLHPASANCFKYRSSFFIFTAFSVTNILLLLPLCVSVLCFGFRRRRKQRSSVATNPTDVFTYHMVAMELIGISGSVACCCGALTDHGKMMGVGCKTFAIVSCMKMFFHVLTCVERYLAIVHPIAYLSLSKTDGVTVRNISIGCVWLLCSGLITLRLLIFPNFTVILFFCNLAVSLIITSFCSLSVLRVLIRPGPGEEGGDRAKVDKTKQRAFITITAIMAVLLLRFGGNLVCMALASSSALSDAVGCAVKVSGVWFCLPSSYVLPLLFLHRAGKRLCFQHNSESG